MILGLVLAGGRSSRMGQDKALLRIDGRTLLERTTEALREVGAGEVSISGAREGGIVDRWPLAGPVGGIASALDALPDAEWLIAPVDMPWLDDTVLAPLLAERSAAVTCWAGHPLPMRLRVDGRVREVLADLMTRPGRDCSIAALQARVGAVALSLDGIDTRRLVNCNTPDQWREANT